MHNLFTQFNIKRGVLDFVKVDSVGRLHKQKNRREMRSARQPLHPACRINEGRGWKRQPSPSQASASRRAVIGIFCPCDYVLAWSCQGLQTNGSKTFARIWMRILDGWAKWMNAMLLSQYPNTCSTLRLRWVATARINAKGIQTQEKVPRIPAESSCLPVVGRNLKHRQSKHEVSNQSRAQL